MIDGTQRIRIIHDDAHDGPSNMARDEALLDLVGAGESPPTLRTYRWSSPTVSLGYFQKYADYRALAAPAGALPVVRRQTGGGAILHDLELTYAVVLPLNHPLIARDPHLLYETAHDALIDCLASHGVRARRCGHSDASGAAKGPFFCFARRHALDVLLGVDKLAGSAQRRTRRAVLQHGSIMLGARFDQQRTAAIPSETGLHPATLARPFAESFSRRAELHGAPGAWAARELAEAERRLAKYRGDAWTKRR